MASRLSRRDGDERGQLQGSSSTRGGRRGGRRDDRGRGRGRGGGRGDGRNGGDGRKRRAYEGDGGRDEEFANFFRPSNGDGSVRGQVDPETQQYFSEISRLVGEGGSVEDPEERAAICASALEEAKGKELELACNSSCGRVLETLLLNSEISLVVSFLERCTHVFASMSMDPGGSHVVEAALKSVAASLRENGDGNGADWYPTLEHALSRICEAMGEGRNGYFVISSRYGSHVLRQLLSLFSGVSLESSSKSGSSKKGAASLALRLGTKCRTPEQSWGHSFPNQLKILMETLLEGCQQNMEELRASSAAGPVLQAMLRAVEGNSFTVTQAIALMLECAQEEDPEKGVVLEKASVKKTVEMVQDSNSSHLMEVMLQVAPDALYMELFERFFQHQLLQLAVHPSANFVIQALIAAARNVDQVTMMLEELENSFAELLAERKAGVVAALLAACLRFHTRQREASRGLLRAINPDTPSPNCIVPRMFFLESLAGTGKFSQEWKPPFGSRLSVLGSAMLQIIFSYPQECCQQFCASMAALDSSDVLHTVRDPGGSRTIEAFLSSGAVPLKHKHRLIAKLKGHFAELGVEPICSYVVEKSFSVGDMKLKEMIAAELTLAESELSKTRNGPFLLKRCNIPSYAKGADQWRKQENSKQGTRELFAEIFQATHEVPFDTKAVRAQPTKVEGKKRKSSSSTKSSEPTASKVSTLNLDDTMAQLGFDLSKFQKSNKKTKVAQTSGNRDLTFGTEHGGLTTSSMLEDRRTKSDDIDMLFMRKSKVQKKRG